MTTDRFRSPEAVVRAVLDVADVDPVPGEGYVCLEGTSVDLAAGWDWLVMTSCGYTPVAARVTHFGGDWTVRLDHQLDTLRVHAQGRVLWMQANLDTKRAGLAWASDIAPRLNLNRVRRNGTASHVDGPRTSRDFTWVRWDEVPEARVYEW